MTPESRKRLRDLVVGHQNYSQFPHFDTIGNLTIGIGRNLTDRGVSINEALEMLDNDITYFSNRLAHNISFFAELDDVRKMVLISMCFNLGVYGVLEFKKMLKAIQDQKYEVAAEEILNSKAYTQNEDRYGMYVTMMRTGEL